MKNLLSKIGITLFVIGGCGIDSNFKLAAGMAIIGIMMIVTEVYRGA